MPRAISSPTAAALLGILLLGSAVLVCAGEAKTEKGFTPIFNGKDLTGWEGEPGWWSVQDGAITGMSTRQKPLDHQSYLFWRGGKPADFDLRADFRFLGPRGKLRHQLPQPGTAQLGRQRLPGRHGNRPELDRRPL